MAASAEVGGPRLHLLLSERELDGAGGPRLVHRLLDEAGPVALHLRGRWSAARLHDHARRIAARAAEARGWCVVNGRPDIALAARAHAVQLGRAALEVRDALVVVAASGRELAVGASVHGSEEAASAAGDGADYLVLGTIYPTPSHPGRPGAGPGLVARCAARVSSATPILAIGGIDGRRIEEVMDAGAYGVVVGRAVLDAADPVAAAAALRAAVEEFATETG